MPHDALIAFTLFAVVTTITPGPNNVMLTATGANVGIWRGLPHLLGIAIGFTLMLVLLTATAGAALIENPKVLLVLRIAGIAVLLWLAWKIATAGRTGPAARERPIGFLGAAAFQWVNPKAWPICAGAVSFLQAEGPAPVAQALIFGVIEIATAIPCLFLWLGFGAALQYALRSDRALRAFNVTMGVILAATVPFIV